MVPVGTVWCDCMHTVKCMWCILRTKAAVKFPMHQEQVLHPTFHFELKCDVQAMLAQCLWSSLSGNRWLHGEEKPLFIFFVYSFMVWEKGES